MAEISLTKDEITSILKCMGFVFMSMDSYSVPQQASIFNSADLIVGAHGSAFVNMIFCRPSTKIIEFFGPGYTSMHDYVLARQCNLSWDYIIGSSESSSSFSSDYTISVQKLLSKLTYDLCLISIFAITLIEVF